MASRGVSLGSLARVLREHGLLRDAEDAPEDLTVEGVTQDSRRVRPGEVFLAWKGVESDAHDHVAEAARAGAAAAVVERRVAGVALPQLLVTDGRLAGALVSDAFFGSPWTRLRMVAITGTNGKTTTALLARHLLSADGPAAALGTLGVIGEDGTVEPGTEGLTTPGPVQLAGWLRELADRGFRSVAMEASSHALGQRRLDAVRFDVAVFTNFSQDHLDYHETLSAYHAAKARLLELLKDRAALVVNADDPAWRDLTRGHRVDVTFGVGEAAALRGAGVELGPSGSRFVLRWRGREVLVDLPLPGRFNVENALAASGAALASGLDLETVADGLRSAPQVPGRMEVVVRDPFTVLIDFAHTPAALERVLEALRPVTRGRLLVAFGAGGDRDRTKRPLMGEAVARVADLVFVTSDNPRTEDPERILDDIVPGLGTVPYRRIADRREAIREALAEAREGDVLLLAGKGHERYQVVGRDKRPFDERSIVREMLRAGKEN